MFKKKIRKIQQLHWRVIACLIIVACSALIALTQIKSDKSEDQEDGLMLSRLHKLPQGKIIATGKNENFSGKIKITDYQIEELQLPQKAKAQVGGQEIETDTAWRITLRGGPFPLRAMPATLFIDGAFVGHGVESPDLKAVTFIVFDKSSLREGATLAFSYGRVAIGEVEMSEKLKLNENRLEIREGEKNDD